MRTWAVLAAALLLVTACGGSESDTTRPPTDPPSSGACGLAFLNSPADVVSEPQLAEVAEDDADLVLDLSSSSRRALQVTVRLNGEVALDVRTPAVPEKCVHAPVYSHGYRLPGDSVQVSVATDRGQRRSIRVPLDGPTHWVAVQPQDGFPIGLDAFEEEPAWG